MNWTQILLTSGFTTTLMVALGFILRKWASARIKESISAEYKKAFELFKQQVAWEQRRKEQAAEVAELLSLWMKGNYDQKADTNLNLYDLQRKYWQLVLWLDAPVLQAVHNAFKNPSNPGISHKEALITVRRKFVGDNDPIRAEELYHWPPVPAGSQGTRGQNSNSK